MIDSKELTIDELKNIVGGTVDESAQLVLPLASNGYGVFLKANTGRQDIVDIEGMQEFFASKGYKFIPGFGDEMNVFIGPDGLPYGNDYIVYLLENRKL